MKNDLLIRDLTSADLARGAPLLAQLGYPVDTSVLEERFEDFIAKGERAIVAERDAEILGLLTLHVTNVLHRAGAVGRITLLVVDEAVQGQGVGRSLMDEAERRLWSDGCVLIEVTSNMKRTDAHAFYEKLGYEKSSFRFGKTRPATTS